MAGQSATIENWKQHTSQDEYIDIEVDSREQTIYFPAGLCTEQHDQFVAASNGKPQFATKVAVRTVHEFQYHVVVDFRIFSDKFPQRLHPEWKNEAIITIWDAMEVYNVEAIAESQM